MSSRQQIESATSYCIADRRLRLPRLSVLSFNEVSYHDFFARFKSRGPLQIFNLKELEEDHGGVSNK